MPIVSRRALLRWMSSLAGLAAAGGQSRAQALDQGIGGTGVAPAPEDRDQGIGGTGVIGTIRRFGSIYVNDLRIAYPTDAIVRIDGEPASLAALKIGQVVRVVAIPRDGGFSTRRIEVTSEVVGPVERVGPSSIIVLGQTVTTGELPAAYAGRVGSLVAVSGLRRPDGSIVASLIEPRPAGVPRVAGPVVRAKDGSLRIGGLRLAGLDAALVGERVTAEVGGRKGSYVALGARAEGIGFGPAVTRLSIEAYVARGGGGGLRLGSGFAVTGGRDLDLPAQGSTRAVLDTSVGANGRLIVDSARIDRGQGRPERPGGRGPDTRGGRPNGPDRGGGPQQGLPGLPGRSDVPGGGFGGPPEAPGGGLGTGGPGGGAFGGGRRR